VSAFFRDPAAFAALADQGLAPLIDSKADHSLLRIWVAGCASGEGAYSLAMRASDRLHHASTSQ
jgi:two-component system CheB/CheR fusion protein